MAEPSEHDKHGRLEHLLQRLRRCGALLTASRRRHEVVTVVGEAGSDEEATQAVSELLEVDTDAAGAIVDMPVKAFTQERVSNLEDEADRLRKKVASLRSPTGGPQDASGEDEESRTG